MRKHFDYRKGGSNARHRQNGPVSTQSPPCLDLQVSVDYQDGSAIPYGAAIIITHVSLWLWLSMLLTEKVRLFSTQLSYCCICRNQSTPLGLGTRVMVPLNLLVYQCIEQYGPYQFENTVLGCFGNSCSIDNSVHASTLNKAVNVKGFSPYPRKLHFFQHVSNMHAWLLSPALLVLCLPLFLWFRDRTRTRPPGPRGLPLLGNIFNAPRKDEWRVYTEWSQQFGSSSYLFFLMNILHQNFLRFRYPLPWSLWYIYDYFELRKSSKRSVGEEIRNLLWKVCQTSEKFDFSHYPFSRSPFVMFNQMWVVIFCDKARGGSLHFTLV